MNRDVHSATEPVVRSKAALVWPVLMAALCVAVLATRVYVDFERLRVRIVTPAQPAEGASLTVPLRNQGQFAGLPVAIILRIHGAPEPVDISVALDGRPVTTTTVPAGREIRIDAAVDNFPGTGREITVTGSRPGWRLTYLETAAVHGYANFPVKLVVVPDARRPGRVVSMWFLLALFAALVIFRPRGNWPAGWLRYPHGILAGFVLLVYTVALLAPVFTRFSILLSIQTFILGAALLYAQPLLRAYKSAREAVSRGFHATDPMLVPGVREVLRATSGGTSPIPRWVTALDVVCLAVLGLMLRSMIGDGYRIALTPEIYISLRSWGRIALVLGVLLMLRHAAWRAVPWHTRVTCWAWSLARWEPLQAIWPSYAISRAAVLVVGYVAVFRIGFSPPRPWEALNNAVLDLHARWDAGWYFDIAKNGYDTHFNPAGMDSIAFFPGLPLLMRITGGLLDVNLWVAGIIVIGVAFLVALTYVYRLALLDMPADHAQASVMLLAFYPFAFCYSAVLTESLFLLCAAATFFYFRRDESWKAGLFGLFTGLLRPNGFLLAVPLGLVAVLPFARGRGWLPGAAADQIGWSELFRKLAMASLPVAGMLAYAAHVYSLTGNPFTFVEAQQAWGRRTAELFNVIDARQALIDSKGLAAYTRGYTIEIIEALAALFALGAVWPIVRRFGLAYGTFVAMAVLPPLISLGSTSLGRYTAPLFPIFLWLGASVPPERRPYWIAAFAAGQALFATLFFTWRPPY